jgi:protein-S-isoprenylcysteine O-methyltransferase Ste14
MWTFIRVPSVSIFLLPTFAHELFVAISFLVREPARRGAPNLASRLAAYGGTFMLLVFFNVARAWDRAWLEVNPVIEVRAAGALLWVVGAIFVLAGVWALRRSFSIEPEARSLVTSGLYRYARHPIYAFYFVQYFGLLLIYPTTAFGSVLVLWAGLMVARMHFEERVLAATFPEYAEYKARVGAFAPRLRRHTPSSLDPARERVSRRPAASEA